MRERSMAAAGDQALVRRMSKSIQKILDLLITNLTSKSKSYKSKVHSLLDDSIMRLLVHESRTIENRWQLTLLQSMHIIFLAESTVSCIQIDALLCPCNRRWRRCS